MTNHEQTIKQTMASLIPTDTSALNAWVRRDLNDAMGAVEYRVEKWVDWISSGEWTLDEIAQAVATVAVEGRKNGKVVDRSTFRNYCSSLSAVSRQIGENPPRSFDGRLDETTDVEKKKSRSGSTLVAAADSFVRKGAKASVYLVAAIFSKDGKRDEKPLDPVSRPEDVAGFVTEASEAIDAAAIEAFRRAEIYAASLELARVSYDPDPDFSNAGSPLMTKIEAFSLHMARVDSLRAELDATKTARKTARKTAKTAKTA